MKIRLVLGVFLVVATGPFFGSGQTTISNNDHARSQIQSACEEKLLSDIGAKEILSGDHYETLRNVATAFGLARVPRLYFFEGGGNSYYIAGSLALDGRGKILMSKRFVDLLGEEPAFKGVVAHEIAHLVVDIHGDTGCDQWVMRDPKVEEAADALAVAKVGSGPVRAFLSRVEAITGTTGGETGSRLRIIEKLESEDNGRR